MTAPHIIDPAGLLGEALSEASPDMMRTLLQTMINTLLSADAYAVVGAEWGSGRGRGEVAVAGGGEHDIPLDPLIGVPEGGIHVRQDAAHLPEVVLVDALQPLGQAIQARIVDLPGQVQESLGGIVHLAQRVRPGIIPITDRQRAFGQRHPPASDRRRLGR